MKWKSKDYDQCDVCGESQTLEHLLYMIVGMCGQYGNV